MHLLTKVKRSRLIFPLACAAAAAMVFISEGSYWRSVSALEKLDTIATTRITILLLAQSILDAESGQRGYLLTSRKEYLQPYTAAVAAIDDSLERLDHFYQEQPEQRALMTRLHALADTKVSELAETIRLHDEGKIDLATELILSDIGKEKMEAIRALGAELLATQAHNVAPTCARVRRWTDSNTSSSASCRSSATGWKSKSRSAPLS
jgi:CHASE3 domain sensor protein